MEPWLWAMVGVVIGGEGVMLLFQAHRLSQARAQLDEALTTRYAVYRREGLRLLMAAGDSGAGGMTSTAVEQEKIAREWLARADQQPDAPLEVRALRELAEVE